MKKLVPRRLRARVGALVGPTLSASVLDFVRADVPGDELATLAALCAIDSPTLDPVGVNRAQDLVATSLARDGFTIARTRGESRFGDLIVAERAGRSAEWITLVTHVDTVLPNFRDFAVDAATDRAFGSGVIDNKGGVVVGLSAVRRLMARAPDLHYGLRFVCSPNEEMGSIGFTEYFRTLGDQTRVAFGLEPALDDGSIIHQRRGNRWYDVEITGREAHAGRSYGRHANAAHDLSRKIVRLAALTNYKKHLAVSVGAISSGHDKHNIICGTARAKLDVRFPSFAARDRLHRRIERILSVSDEVSVGGEFRTHARYAIVDDCPPFGLTTRSKRAARAYGDLIGAIEGAPAQSRSAGGAGDVNYLSTARNLVLDGLGPVGGEMHTKDEWLKISTLGTRARALAGFLKHLNDAPIKD